MGEDEAEEVGKGQAVGLDLMKIIMATIHQALSDSLTHRIPTQPFIVGGLVVFSGPYYK